MTSQHPDLALYNLFCSLQFILLFTIYFALQLTVVLHPGRATRTLSLVCHGNNGSILHLLLNIEMDSF